MEADNYNVVFSGQLEDGMDSDEVRKRLAKMLGKPPKQVEFLFSGKRHVLKTVSNREEGQRLIDTLSRAGARAQLVPANDPKAGHTRANKANADRPLEGSIQPGVAYRSRMTTAALATGFILLAHLAVLGTFTGALLYHLVVNLRWYFEYGPLALLMHFVPSVLGVVLLGALVKPLLPVSRRPGAGLAVAPDQQPELYEFAERIADELEAPLPRGIVIECGTELEFQPTLRDGYELRIGLMRLSGCTAQQLAGAVGREMAYFSKGTAARRSLLVREVHKRLRAAVFETDHFDTLLERLSENHRLAAPLVNGLEWLLGQSRRMHLGLLRMEDKVASGALRQLELRVDEVQMQIAGSEQYRNMLARLHLLQLTFESAAGEAQMSWNDKGEVPASLPAAALNLARTRAEKLQHEVVSIMRGQHRDPFDPRASDLQRAERAELLNQLAENRLEGAARELVRRFDRLNQRVSFRYYRNVLDLTVTPDRLVQMAEEQSSYAIEPYTYGLDRILVGFELTSPLVEPSAAARYWQDTMAELKQEEATARTLRTRYLEVERQLIEATCNEVLGETRLSWADRFRKKDKEAEEALHAACRRLEMQEDKVLKKAEESTRLIGRRVAHALMIAKATLQGEQRDRAATELDRLQSALARMNESMAKTRSLRLHGAVLELLLSYMPTGNDEVKEQIEARAGDVRQLLLGIRLGYKQTPWPFASKSRKESIATHVFDSDFQDATPDELLDLSVRVVDRILAVRQQILTRLIQVALAGEKRLLNK